MKHVIPSIQYFHPWYLETLGKTHRQHAVTAQKGPHSASEDSLRSIEGAIWVISVERTISLFGKFNSTSHPRTFTLSINCAGELGKNGGILYRMWVTWLVSCVISLRYGQHLQTHYYAKFIMPFAAVYSWFVHNAPLFLRALQEKGTWG